MVEVCRIFKKIEELKKIFSYSEALRIERINEVPRTVYLSSKNSRKYSNLFSGKYYKRYVFLLFWII